MKKIFKLALGTVWFLTKLMLKALALGIVLHLFLLALQHPFANQQFAMRLIRWCDGLVVHMGEDVWDGSGVFFDRVMINYAELRRQKTEGWNTVFSIPLYAMFSGIAAMFQTFVWWIKDGHAASAIIGTIGTIGFIGFAMSRMIDIKISGGGGSHGGHGGGGHGGHG